jgi:very-short-patch-repair endonuclease
MIEKQSSDKDRQWALRDRDKKTPNHLRARAMRLSQTDAEKKLWWHLRHRLSLQDSHFRRQVRIGHYIVDFASHGLKIAIEIDGSQHAEQMTYDGQRSAFLESKGYRVLRFWNGDVLTNIDGVLETIHSAILTTPTPTPPHKGEGKEEQNA